MNGRELLAHLQREADRTDGKLPRRIDGGYPIVYYAACGDEYCAECANQQDAEPPIVMADVLYDGAPVYCTGCGVEIESAYGDPDTDTDTDDGGEED